jgi:outer membrane receptor protein involved in Fe transport
MTGLFSNPYTPHDAQHLRLPGAGPKRGVVGFATYQYGEPFTPGRQELLRQAVADAANQRQRHQDPGRPHHQGRRLLGLRPQLPDQRHRGWRDQRRSHSTFGGANTSTGNYLANFVTGRMKASTRQCRAVQDMKYHQISFFFNDQWKASRRLTLTGGLRFEHMGNWVPNDSQGVAVWDPPHITTQPSAPGYTGLEWHSIDSAIPLSGFPSRRSLSSRASASLTTSSATAKPCPRRRRPVPVPDCLQHRQFGLQPAAWRGNARCH